MANENDENNGSQETAVQKATRLKRQFQQSLKKLSDEERDGFDLSDFAPEDGGNDDSNKPNKNDKPDSKEFDYGQLAYLKANGIDTEEEIALAQKAVNDSGKELKDVLNSGWFKGDLETHREQVAADLAADEASKTGERGDVTNTKDTPEYWVKKGELPPNTPENQQLRRDVVNARTAAETSGSKFTDTPVVE